MNKLFIILLVISSSFLFSQNLTIYIINVGQGDALLITDNKKSMMIDMGGKYNSPQTSLDTTLALLNKLNIKKLDYVVISHYDADHICNAVSILNSGITVDSLFDRGLSALPTTATYNNYANAVKNFRNTMKFNQEIKFSDKVNIRCISVNGKYTEKDSVSNIDENERSVGLIFKIGNIYFYTAGDLHMNVEDRVIEHLSYIDVFKVSHHGSKESTTDYFLNKIDPQCCMISVGDNNTYDHPTTEALGRMQIKNSIKTIYQTQQGIRTTSKSKVVGTIKIEFYDNFYVVNKDTFRLAANGIDNPKEKPLNFNLKQNYPNPFNPNTTIEYSIEKSSNVVLKVFNSLGQEVAELVNSKIQPGNYKVNWYGNNCSSGVYYYNLNIDGLNTGNKMLLLK